MDEPLLTILYVSAAKRLLSDEALAALLAAAREHNARHGITGLLLYSDGNFMQLLEGPATAVSALYGRIQQDARHHMVTTVLEESGLPREFSDWSMACRRVDAPTWLQLTHLVGAGGEGARLGIIKELLASFWKSVA